MPVRSVNASGAATEEIVREADALDAALVVLGSRGVGFLRRLVLGTTSERLLRRTTRPLLVVRQTPHEPYRRVRRRTSAACLNGAAEPVRTSRTRYAA